MIEGKDYLKFHIQLGDLWQVICTSTHMIDSYWEKEEDAKERKKQLIKLYGRE